MDGIPLSALGEFSPTALLGLVFLLVVWGKLVPSRLADKNDQRNLDAIARADQVIQTQAQTILELTVAANNSLNVARSSNPAPTPGIAKEGGAE